MRRKLHCDQCGAVVGEGEVKAIRHRTITLGGPQISDNDTESVCPRCEARDSLDDYEEPPMQIRDMTVGEFLDAVEAEWGGTALYTHIQLHWTSHDGNQGKPTIEWYREDTKGFSMLVPTWDEFVAAVQAHCAKGPERQAEQDRLDAARLQAAGWAVSPPEPQPAVLQETGQ